jgi:hypothetical protein
MALNELPGTWFHGLWVVCLGVDAWFEED